MPSWRKTSRMRGVVPGWGPSSKVSVASGRSFEGGGVELEVLERSFRG